ncbi:MAG: transposase [Anaerolineaceae bacterium]
MSTQMTSRFTQPRPETLIYMDFPREHWKRIGSNNTMERLNREIRCRTRTVGAFPDGRSALMLVCARLRYMEQSGWGQKTYLSMQHLEELFPSDS